MRQSSPRSTTTAVGCVTAPRTRAALVLGAVLAWGVAVPAQQPAPPAGQPAPVFRTSADVATIDAVVTDSDGNPVTDLTRDDFEVTVAGKRRTLDQAVYVRTRDQPRVLAAARAAAGTAQPAASPESEASRILRTSGVSPDSIARTIAIVVDDLGLSFRGAHDVRKALHRYIDTQIAPGDLVAIIRTAGGIGALQQFTTDKRLLHEAADRIQWDFRSRVGLGGFSGYTAESATPGGQASNSIDDLHNAIAGIGSLAALEYIARGAAPLPGRKTIIFFSEGFSQLFDDRATGGRIWNAMSHMLTQVNAAGVVIDTIDARGLSTEGLHGQAFPNPYDWRTRDGFRDPSIQRTEGVPTLGSGNGYLDAPGHLMGAADGNSGRAYTANRPGFISSQESLAFIADQTGGLAFRDNNDLNLGVQRMLDDLDGYYLLGYAASGGGSRVGWDQGRVKVRVKRPGLHVRARQGFFGPLEAQAATPAPADPLVMAAISPFGAGAITTRLTSLFGHADPTGSYVRSLIFVDPSGLRFGVNDEGLHTAEVQVLLMAVGDNGRVVDGWRRSVQIALSDDDYRLLGTHGLVVTARSRITDPGPYQIRTAVQDMNSRDIGSASQFLDVPAVGKDQLALSGVLLKGTPSNAADTAADAPHTIGLGSEVLLEPEVRVLHAGTKAVYAYEIYDGLKGEDPPLQMSVSLLRDGKAVYEAPFAPVTAAPKADHGVRTIPIAGTLNLGAGMPPGRYTLEVTVRRQAGKKAADWHQWADFDIRE